MLYVMCMEEVLPTFINRGNRPNVIIMRVTRYYHTQEPWYMYVGTNGALHKVHSMKIQDYVLMYVNTTTLLRPILLTWINLNLGMDQQSYAQ